MSFTHKVVLVVGASSGIGASTAVSFAKEGATVAIIGRNEEKLKSVSDQCEKYGKNPLVIKADISKEDEALSAVKRTIEKYGKLDILINNAGIIRFGNILTGSIMNTYDELMNTNLRAIIYMTTISVPHLVKSKGNIVNISSIGGTSTTTYVSPIYGVSKAGLNHFGRLAANELASVGVRVNTISPGPVYTDIMKNAGVDIPPNPKATEMTPLKRFSDPQEIADLILFVASDKAKVVLVLGASSGIGAATALSFVREDANVAIIGRNEKKIKTVSELFGKIDKKPLVIIANITKDDEALMAINKTIEQFGTLDILINNAGIIQPGNILSGSIMKTYDVIMNTNLRSIVNITSLAAPHLVKSKGNIINISSIAGIRSSSWATPMYGVSKAGLSHFGRLAASELASFGVRVNTVSPGPVFTDILTNADIQTSFDELGSRTALKRISDPQEIADLILFLASDQAKGITGSEYVSDNGALLIK